MPWSLISAVASVSKADSDQIVTGCLPADEAGTVGDDSHCILETDTVTVLCINDTTVSILTYCVAVADGVGAWHNRGIDPSAFSRTLMEHISEPSLETNSEDAPAMKVLKAAFRGLIEKYIFDQEEPFGSSTICVAVLDKRSGWLDLVNLGDSCAVVFRRGHVRMMAERRQCGFNRPLQLTLDPSGKARGNPNDADHQSLGLEDGDILIMATDGLWDNMFLDQIEQRLHWYEAEAFSSGSFDIEAFVLELINTARQTSIVEFRPNATPFAIESEKAGFFRPGGKKDDITVIAALAYRD